MDNEYCFTLDMSDVLLTIDPSTPEEGDEEDEGYYPMLVTTE